MLGNNIPINETVLLEEVSNLQTHLIATLSRHQTDGSEDGREVRPDYLFVCLKIHNRASGLHSEKYCQYLISKASQTKTY